MSFLQEIRVPDATIRQFETHLSSINVARGARGEPSISDDGWAVFLSEESSSTIRKVWIANLRAQKPILHKKTIAVYAAVNAVLIKEKLPSLKSDVILTSDAVEVTKNTTDQGTD